jgi:hypothetical protein
MRSKSALMDETKQKVLSKADRLEVMKTRLRKRAREA